MIGPLARFASIPRLGWGVGLALALTALPGRAAEPSGKPAKQAAKAAASAQKAKVILQVTDNDPKRWTLTFMNAENLQKALGNDKTEIEVVAYGPGIMMLKGGTEAAARIDKALADGVKVVACETTMGLVKLTKDDMHKGISYVAAGVVELVHKQQEGFVYIRP